MKKLLTAGLLIAALYACAENQKATSDPGYVNEGAQLYKKYCVICHGADGKLGVNGAKDITASPMTLEERVALINTGKNTMTPFEGILTPDQMRAVANYTMQLK